MSTLTAKLPKLPANLTEVIDLDEAKKPLLAAVGVVDLTVEQAKELPAEAKKLQAKLTETLTAQLEARRAQRTEQLKAVPAQLKALPTLASEKATALRGDLEARLAKAQSSATDYYGTLAIRGEKLVAQVRKPETTKAALAEGKAAVKKAVNVEKAASTATATAKKATKAASSAASTATKAAASVATAATSSTPATPAEDATEQAG